MTPVLASIGIGSNLDDSAGYVREGFAALERVGRVTATSDLYLTAPWGVADQPPYVNAAAVVETTMSAPALLQALLDIEGEFGRTRDARYGPRVIDFDILMYGDRVLDDPACTIPHPQLRRRAFALAPLADIAGDVPVPGAAATVRELFEALPQAEREGVLRLRGTARLDPPPHLDYDAPGGPGDGYAELRPFSAFDTAVLDAALHSLGPIAGQRILDVGCGTGRFTRELARRGALVTGLDPSETMLGAARAAPLADAGSAPTYVRGDADEDLPGADYDAITSFYALQYLNVRAFCRRALGALATSGRLVLASFPHRHFAESEFARFFPSMVSLDLARFPSRQRLEHAFRDAGFLSVRSAFIALELHDAPDLLIAKVERKYLSSFHLLSDVEFRNGLAAMREAWRRAGDVRRTAHAMVVSGEKGLDTRARPQGPATRSIGS